MKNRKLTIDMINLIMGLGIIALAVTAFASMPLNRNLFPVIFMMGTVMLSLNAAKFFQKHRLTAIIFALLSLVSVALLITSLLQIAF